jgi:hypothetical protein
MMALARNSAKRIGMVAWFCPEEERKAGSIGGEAAPGERSGPADK